jgi:dolichyl-phosphate-mannose-protein mannosyltransferase
MSKDGKNSMEKKPNSSILASEDYSAKTFSAYESVRGPQKINLVVCCVLTLIALVVRLYNIHDPAQVVFDEVHFGWHLIYSGTHASKYIKNIFFFDVHPPLGKLMIALSGLLGGYDGSFSFEKIGMPYTDSVPYILMRAFPAVLGALISPVFHF